MIQHLPEQPPWPSRRSLARYEELTGFDIRKFLDAGHSWIDVGPGTEARALDELAGKEIELIGISPHKMDVPSTVEVYPNSLPDDLPQLEVLTERANLLTDIYGAFSYAANPLDVLIAESLLVKPCGKFFCISETTRFGTAEDQARATEFFQSRLGVHLSFVLFETFADARQEWEQEMRVIGEKFETVPVTDYSEVFSQAKKIIGEAVQGDIRFEVEHKGKAGESLGRIFDISFRR